SADHEPSVYGQPVTFTVDVTAKSPGAGTPTGSSVTLYDGSLTGTKLGDATLVSPGVYSLSNVSSLSVASVPPHTIVVDYGGDNHFLADNTQSGTHVVNKADTKTVLSPTTVSKLPGESFDLVAMVQPVNPPSSAPGQKPSTTVTFTFDNGGGVRQAT